MKNLIVIILLLLVGAGVIFVGYKLYKRNGRVAYDNSLSYASNVPSSTAGANDLVLDITSHKDGDTVNVENVIIKGKTVPNAEVSVDDVETKADASGNFSATITLDEGENSIVIVTNDANGNYVEKELTLTLDSSV